VTLQEQVTVCVVTCGRPDALSLMYRSFVHHHGEGCLFYVWDNSEPLDHPSFHPTRFFAGNSIPHGMALDAMVKLAETPYVVICDDDTEVREPVIQRMIDLCEFCVCPPRLYDPGPITLAGHVCEWQTGIDPSRAMFKTEKIQRILAHFSFAGYDSRETHKHYDSATMVHEVARVLEWPVATPEWLLKDWYHWGGGVTWAKASPLGDQNRITSDERYAEIQARLKSYE